MTFAATIRVPGAPPAPVPPFAAKTDAEALAVIRQTAAALGAAVVMAWESRDDEARRIA